MGTFVPDDRGIVNRFQQSVPTTSQLRGLRVWHNLSEGLGLSHGCCQNPWPRRLLDPSHPMLLSIRFLCQKACERKDESWYCIASHRKGTLLFLPYSVYWKHIARSSSHSRGGLHGWMITRTGTPRGHREAAPTPRGVVVEYSAGSVNRARGKPGTTDDIRTHPGFSA